MNFFQLLFSADNDSYEPIETSLEPTNEPSTVNLLNPCVNSLSYHKPLIRSVDPPLEQKPVFTPIELQPHKKSETTFFNTSSSPKPMTSHSSLSSNTIKIENNSPPAKKARGNHNDL